MRGVVIPAIIVCLFGFAYHEFVVQRELDDLRQSQVEVYVFDPDQFAMKVRDEAKDAILAGIKINPEQFFDMRQHELDEQFAALPQNSVVIRSDMVFKGGRNVDSEFKTETKK